MFRSLIHFGFTFVYGVGEGNGTPLQYSCLENPMDGGAWWAAVHGVAKLDTTEQLHFHFSLSCIGEENGSPLQCSCLKNPRDGAACWAAVYGVAQSQTRLKLLSSNSRFCAFGICEKVSFLPQISVPPFVYVYFRHENPVTRVVIYLLMDFWAVVYVRLLLIKRI